MRTTASHAYRCRSLAEQTTPLTPATRRKHDAWVFILAGAKETLPQRCIPAKALRILRGPGKLKAFCGHSRREVAERFGIEAEKVKLLHDTLEVHLLLMQRDGTRLREFFERFADFGKAHHRAVRHRTNVQECGGDHTTPGSPAVRRPVPDPLEDRPPRRRRKRGADYSGPPELGLANFMGTLKRRNTNNKETPSPKR